MKAIVENQVNFSSHRKAIQDDFCEILSIIGSCDSEKELRKVIAMELEVGEWDNFKVGFGGSHMWVKQIIDGDPKQQVIFVEF